MKKISGVVIKNIDKHTDERGWLCEAYRYDETAHSPQMAYFSHTNYNSKRGPHEHTSQSDFFVFGGYGDFELYLWDARKNSETYNTHLIFVVGESNPCSVIIPPG